MPIRINLKEVFTADSQDLIINKVNFNFNKLLELGIGEDGPIGLTGPQGPAGPTGLPGDPGTPGNIWYVGTTADPNNESFPEVNTGDFYLDTVLFTIWRYNGTIWIQQTDITQIINDYLSTAGSVFTRGFGNGTADNNFIVFNNRGQDATRRLNDSNDILFLNNFSETYLNSLDNTFTLNASAFFNSLLSISVDRSNSAAPYRQHIELGVLYGDGSGTPEGHTSTNESLKIKYEKVDSSVLGNDYYNIATLSLDLPETVSVGRTTNGVFNFVSPKMYTGNDTNSNVYIGSRYGLDEVYGVAGTIKADGLLFYKSGDALYANIGIAQDFLIPNYPASTGYVTNLATNGYFMIDSVNTTLTGVYLNDPLYLTGGNVIQLGNTTPREVAATAVLNTAKLTAYSRGGISVVGNTIFTINGEVGNNYSGPLNNDFGWLNRFNIDDPNLPIATMNITYNGTTSGTTGLIGSSAADIVANGKYVYIVNDQNILNTPTPGLNKRTYFQILAPNDIDSDYTRISRLGEGSLLGSFSVIGEDPEELNGAYRIKIKGGYALIATNALNSIGNNSHGRQFLGQYETSIAGERYDGYITSIDITNPAIPRIKSSATNTKETISDWVANNGSATYIQRSAMLDFDIASEYAYALAWEQTVSDTAATSKICVKLVAFDISNPSSITYHGKSDSASNGLFINGYYDDAAIDLLPKNGAIIANDQYVYAGYGQQIKVFRTNDKTGSYIFPVASTYTISGLSSSQYITDIKKVGNSLYALVTLNLVSAPYTKIYKFNINDSTLTKVWEKEISGTSVANQFVIVGKHIYCSVLDRNYSGSNNPALITIDYDGIYTGGAHIESLRSDNAGITQDLTVGGHAQLDSSLTVGGPVGIQGQLEVGLNARINGELHVTNYGSDVSSIEVGINRTTNGYAYLDLVGDTTYTDYGLRLIRNSTGANTTSELAHHGTGNLEIITKEAATIAFKTSDTLKAQIDLVGFKTVDGAASDPSISFLSDTGTGFYRIGASTIGITAADIERARFDTGGIKLVNGTAVYPSYSFINDTDSGLYLISDGNVGITANGQFIANLNGTGIKLINGTAASPSYSFYNDTDSGLYLISDGSIGITANGQFKASIDTSGIKLINGSAAAPSYSFYNDANSGMYSITDGIIGFAINSQERFRIEDAGITFGDSRTSNGYAYLDLVGDTTYTDYGLRLIRNATGPNTTSELIHSGTGNLEISTNHSADIAFKTNISVDSNPRALINTTGIKLINGTAASPSYSFINDTDTGLYLDSAGTLGFTTNGTERAYLNSDGLNITVNGGSLALRGTDHSYIRFYGRGNLANPGVISEQSAYIGFPDSATDLFYIFNQRLNTIITLEETGKFSLRNNTAQSIPYTSLQVVTNRETGYLWNGNAVSAGVTLDATIFAGGNVYLYTTPGGPTTQYWWAYDDRNLSIRHDQPGYINILNTPAYVTGSSLISTHGIPTYSDIGWSPTHSNVHTRFASQDGSTEYANINTNGLTIKNRIDFSDSNDVLSSLGGPAWIHFDSTSDTGRLEFSCKGRNNLMLYNAGGSDDSPRLMLRDDGATTYLELQQFYSGGSPYHCIATPTGLFITGSTVNAMHVARPLIANGRDAAGTVFTGDNQLHLLEDTNQFNFNFKGTWTSGADYYFNYNNYAGGNAHDHLYFFRGQGGAATSANYMNLYAAGFSTASDRRLKEDIQTIPSVIDNILKINIVTFSYIGDIDKSKNFGVIAQEFKEIYPELVTIANPTHSPYDDLHSVDYGKLTPILIKGLQEVIIENTELKAKNQELEARLAAIEAKLGL